MPCISPPNITLPVLGAGLSIPALNLTTPGSLLCCKLPVFSLSLGPFNLGISTGILQVIAAILDTALEVVFAFLNELIALLCPFSVDESLL